MRILYCKYYTFKALEKGDINNGKNKNNDNNNNNNVVAQSRIDLSKRYLFHGPMDSWKAGQCFFTSHDVLCLY